MIDGVETVSRLVQEYALDSSWIGDLFVGITRRRTSERRPTAGEVLSLHSIFSLRRREKRLHAWLPCQMQVQAALLLWVKKQSVQPPPSGRR